MNEVLWHLLYIIVLVTGTVIVWQKFDQYARSQDATRKRLMKRLEELGNHGPFHDADK